MLPRACPHRAAKTFEYWLRIIDGPLGTVLCPRLFLLLVAPRRTAYGQPGLGQEGALPRVQTSMGNRQCWEWGDAICPLVLKREHVFEV